MHKKFYNLSMTNSKMKKTLKKLWISLKIKTNSYVKLRNQLKNNKNITMKLKRVYDYEFFLLKKDIITCINVNVKLKLT